MGQRRRQGGHVVVAVLACAAPALLHAQGLPTEPIAIADGRVVISGEVVGTVAPDDPGYFTYTDYSYSLLRNLRASVLAEARVSRAVQVLAEVRAERRAMRPYGLYLRVRPWDDRAVSLQVGRVPPTFGAFARHAYTTDNPLIGTPLAYQYLTSLRTDALPADRAELLRMRGRGWRSAFSVGSVEPGAGLPIINTTRWDTGVQLHAAMPRVEGTAAITTGSLANPRVDDDNDGRQMAGRVVWRPRASLTLGGSVARGAYLSRSLDGAVPGNQLARARQQAAAADAEWSKGRWLTRGEVIWSAWAVPLAEASTPLDLGARAVHGEGRYRVVPGVYVAVRAERLSFSSVETAEGRQVWEFPVARIESTLGWTVTRNVLVKGGVQRNSRDGGRVRHDTLWSLQAAYWF